MKQVLDGLAHLHEKAIIHRDIKGGNILMSKDGIIKLADFGLARTFFPGQNYNYTPKVVTLWYRAPELLLGMRNYTGAIDMWSVGCLFAELMTGKPIFPAKDEA
jgi:cyclin-dependent kinase 12/13